MRSLPLRHALRSTVAVGAVVLASAEAQAACTTANGIVTCTGASTVDETNAAIDRTTPPSVRVNIATGATVTRGVFTFNPNITPNTSNFQPTRFTGVVGYTNDGTVGTAALNVGFNYFGNLGSPSNSFDLLNRGTQNGRIEARGVGGAITANNSGTITGGLELGGQGPITLTSSGLVFERNFAINSAISLSSAVTRETQGTDGVFRSVVTGGLVTATVTGSTVRPTDNIAQNVFAQGVGGSDVTIGGSVGSVFSSSDFDNVDTFNSSTFSGGVFTSSFLRDVRTIGGDARGTVSAGGQVGALTVNTGPGTATAVVNGSVINIATGFGGRSSGDVTADATGVVTTSRSSSTSSSGGGAPSSSNTQSSSQIVTGGAALVDIGATGRATGAVTATSNAGTATVRIAGTVGTASNNQFGPSIVAVGATSTGTNFTRQSNSAVRPDGTSESSSLSTQSVAGGAATVSVASTGRVLAGTTVRGDTSATIDNAGNIAGDATATSVREISSATSRTASRTITTNAAGVRDQVDREANRDTTESLGGTAAIVNRAGASIGGSVSVDANRGATFDNAGTVANDVTLNSFGERVTLARDLVTTNSRAPATGGSVVTNTAEETQTQSFRSTGGTAAGTYGGTIGAAQPRRGFPSTVTQEAALTSTATVTGTIFGNFAGTAGSQNSDTSSNSTSRTVTQPNGASTRDTTSNSREVTTQIASTSTLTVTPTGRIVSNGTSGGNVAVTSQGGDAVFTLDGGQVSGNADINAAAGTNLTRTTATTASFTRAPSTGGIVAPEVQQRQTNDSTSDERQAPGTATARIVNGGLLVGNLTVRGSGTGTGTLGSNVVVDGTVSGSLSAFATGTDERSTSSSVTTRTGPTAVNRTTTTTSLSSPSANAGGVSVAISGTVGGALIAGADAGNVTVNLTGTAGSLSRGGVQLSSFDFASARRTDTTAAGTSFFNLQNTGSVVSQIGNASGGAATLNIAASLGLRNTGASSVEGDIVVRGFAGSTLNVAAGSQVLQNQGQVFLGVAFANSNTTTTSTFANGVLTGSTTNTTTATSGGPTTLNNAGVIGSAANQVATNLFSVTAATATNTGTLNGSLNVASRTDDRVTTTTLTDANVLANRRSVTTTLFTGRGGAARVDNSGLVTGAITAVGANGTVTNSGVVRGLVTLGGAINNFSSTTTTVAGAPNTVAAPLIANAARVTQTYTLNQNGLLLGGVAVTGTTSPDPSGGTARTSSVNATVNLNNGSVTLGDIAGGTDTTTNVNLNGSGFLGIATNDFLPRPVAGQPATAFAPTPALARFTAIDPTIGTTAILPTGSRISGVQTLTRSGEGTFVIVGAPGIPAFGTAPAIFTLDVGTLRNNSGELQLGLAGVAGDAFAIRGNVENNASFVLGRRITNGAQSAILGTNISVLGNVNNAANGNIVVGFNPTFVQTANGLAPFVLGSPGLASTNSFLRVDGNLNLAGNVAVQGISGALYEAGRAQDLFSVSGTFANTGTVRSNFASPFVGFTLTPRSEGGRTIVSLGVVRTAFDTVTTDDNAGAAARSFQAALPSIFGGIRSGANAADTQDLARIVTLLDTQLTADQANQVFRELSSGEFYGSLSAVSTTVPFGEATDGLTSSVGDDEAGEGKSGIGLWFRPTGQSAKFKRDDRTGASEIDVLNYGGSIGLNYSTGAGGSIGIAGGYGKLDVDATSPERAEADTIMVGIYAAQQYGGLHLSGQAVYGKSEWDVSRTLSLLGRRATASFDSEEIRANARIAYTVAPLPGLDISPFAKVEARRYDFDGFTETGAGAVSLVVAGRARTIVSPEVGLRMAGAVGRLFRPFAEASYIFNGDVGSDRRMGFTGNRVQDFVTRGVDPQDSIKSAIGVVADLPLGTVFLRGDYASGGQQQVGSVRGGVLLAF